MQKIIIAFDVDGTLRDNQVPETRPVQANEDIRQLLILLSHMANVYIVVWSARGQQYATEMAHRLTVHPYVDQYLSKGRQADGSFTPPIRPHIAIDDRADCALGVVSLLVGTPSA